MASLEGVNYAKTQENPIEMIDGAEFGGKPRVHYDEHTFAADVNAIGDVIRMGGKLPKNARIIRATVKCPSLGTTGILKFGYEAASDGSESADDDGFIVVANLDAGGQDVLGKESAASAAIGKKMSGEVQPILTFTEASDDAADVKIQSWIEYILD